MTREPSHQKHRASAAEGGPIRVGVITVSDTRQPETDESGAYLIAALEAAGHALVAYRIVPDDPLQVGSALDEQIAGAAQAVLLNGGTGIASRDNTYEALAESFDRTLPGFGELFRMLSWREIGAAAMLSRAIAGTREGCMVFSLPGSPHAVRLAWTELIEPELAHLVWELAR
jgi:molybdenum cofactor biosynthesis protein B